MRMIDIQELQSQAGEIMRQVQEQGGEFVVTDHGRPVARLAPVEPPPQPSRADIAAYLARLDQLAAELSEQWPAGVSAAQAVSEDRREL